MRVYVTVNLDKGCVPCPVRNETARLLLHGFYAVKVFFFA